MAVEVRDIKRWLETLDDYDRVGISDDGLTLLVEDDALPYLEIGGIAEG